MTNAFLPRQLAPLVCFLVWTQLSLTIVSADNENHVVVFSPDGSRIALGNDRFTKLWNAKTGEEITTFEGGPYPVFSPDGSRIMSINFDDTTIELRDTNTGNAVNSVVK